MLVRDLIVYSIFSISGVTATPIDYSQYVNPFIGSEGPIAGKGFGGGDIFVGGALPFGVVKVGIDTTAANWSIAVLNGGWTPDGNVTGISMMHESGTGGAPKYGLISQMPLTSIAPPVNILDNLTYSQPRVGNDTASVGYFKSQLQNGVTIELSGSRHSGIIQYSFPEGEKHVLVDVSHYLPGSPSDTSPQFYVGGEIEISQDGASYSGYGTYIGGWNNGAPFTVYFYGEFNHKPSTSQTFTGVNTDPIPRYQNLANGGISEPVYGNISKATSGPLNDRVGALFTWDDSSQSSQISSRVGISFISVDKAHSYIKSEISSWNLNDTVTAAVKEWNQDVFSKIQVPLGQSANFTHLRLLYSSLYFMHLMPSDRSGENPLWESDEPFWDDFYTMWDIFRCTVSFYHLVQPTYYESMIRSLIDIWRHQGFLPDGRSGNWNGLVQGGSNADNVLADAYVKGLRGAINWTDGYAAMKKDAEVIPYNTYDPTDYTASTKEGRGALGDWKELGYVSQDRNTRCISRTVEYSLNDFALSQVAAGEVPEDQQKYLKRSANWQNIWDHNVTSLAVPWEYSFVIPHDMETLVEFMGGPTTFESRLDLMFKPNMSQQSLGANGAGITTLMNIGNEPDFATPYLYHYISKQAKSVQQSRSLANQYFKDAPYGIPGNSDAGAMNSWLLWNIIGIYPVVTQPVYLLGSPWFPDLNMTINGNKTLRITATGQDKGNFVQGVQINGKQWNKNWFEHKDVMVDGGIIEFQLGSEMKVWETGEVPPSPGHYTL
ncbi:CAZyme family GH92 [Paecilomyces variotii]|nr:CAZyme family GH92 [Paecilomyces variotii]